MVVKDISRYCSCALASVSKSLCDVECSVVLKMNRQPVADHNAKLNTFGANSPLHYFVTLFFV